MYRLMCSDMISVSERCAEWVMGINPIGVSLMDVSLTISFRDRTLTDGMQIVNLSEMSWLTGMPWETRHQDVGGEFVSGKDAFTFSFGYLTCSVILRLTDMSVTVYSRSVSRQRAKKALHPQGVKLKALWSQRKTFNIQRQICYCAVSWALLTPGLFPKGIKANVHHISCQGFGSFIYHSSS